MYTIRPSLESITIRGRYKVFCSFQKFVEQIEVPLEKAYHFTAAEKFGNSIFFEYDYLRSVEKKRKQLTCLFMKNDAIV